MNAVRKAWAPGGADLSPKERNLLAVQAHQKPSHDLYVSLLATKFQQLIDADHLQARSAMEMSLEHAPELWSIAECGAPSHWGEALARSDVLMPILAKINWDDPGDLKMPSASTLRELLEVL